MAGRRNPGPGWGSRSVRRTGEHHKRKPSRSTLHAGFPSQRGRRPVMTAARTDYSLCVGALPGADVLASLQARDRTLLGSVWEVSGAVGCVFLVAFGIDYSIFPHRPHLQEAAKLGTRCGTLLGLAVTGGIITAASIAFAGTSAALAGQKTVEVTDVGIAVALGVLLDALLVRTMLIPATLLALHQRAWWPTRRGGRRPKRGDGP
jgi:hypothetical protein